MPSPTLCECDEQDEQTCDHAPAPCFAPATKIVSAVAGFTIAFPLCADCYAAHKSQLEA